MTREKQTHVNASLDISFFSLFSVVKVEVNIDIIPNNKVNNIEKTVSMLFAIFKLNEYEVIRIIAVDKNKD